MPLISSFLRFCYATFDFGETNINDCSKIYEKVRTIVWLAFDILVMQFELCSLWREQSQELIQDSKRMKNLNKQDSRNGCRDAIEGSGKLNRRQWEESRLLVVLIFRGYDTLYKPVWAKNVYSFILNSQFICVFFLLEEEEETTNCYFQKHLEDIA